MDLRNITEEIKITISDLMDKSESVLHPDWITMSVMSNHPDVEGEDADFALVGCKAFVRNETRKQINRIKSADEADYPEQLVMPGCNHLQKYYACERDGERCAVRVDMMTDDELQQKAGEYRSMGRACLDHADEIERYLSDRLNGKLPFVAEKSTG